VFARLCRAVDAVPLPAWDDGRIRLAADVSDWLRPDAGTSPERLLCHCYARGKGSAQLIPGWPCSWVAALGPGRSSWTLPLDAVRLGPADDATEVTAAQLRDVVTRIIGAGHWKDGDPDIAVFLDSGYDLTRLAWLLRDLPLEVCGRLRGGQVMYFPAPAPRARGARPSVQARCPAQARRPCYLAGTRRHRPGGHRPVRRRRGEGVAAGAAETVPPGRLGTARGRAPRSGGHPHPPRSRVPARAPRPGPGMAVVLPGRHHRRRGEPGLAGVPPPLRSRTYLQVPQAGSGADPPQAPRPGRWTWLALAAYVQLYLARSLAADDRLPWQRPCPPGRLTPARVRRGFRRVRGTLPVPASAPKPSRPGPGAGFEEPESRCPARCRQNRQENRREEQETAGRQLK
jgi:hypothetical protein